MKIQKNYIQLFFFCFIFCCCKIGFTQQLPQYTQWASHQFAINPAHAGIKNCLDVHSLFRTQWQGFEGAPKSGFLTLAAPIKTKRKQILSARHGIGGRVEVDNIGPFSSNRLNLAYAAHFNFSPDTRLSLGLYGGFIQFGYSPQNMVTINPDPSISKDVSFIKPDASFGAWWNGKNYYFGLILQNLIHSKWDDIGIDSKFRFHTLINGGYRYQIHEDLTFLPGFLLKFPPKGPAALDLNFLFDFKNKFGLGFGYRNTDAFLFFANFKIKQQLTVQYSFDFVTSVLRKGTIHSHEISLVYTTCKPKDTHATKCSLFE
jgi:type IX secretion system PorP/SprF family membrane protein